MLIIDVWPLQRIVYSSDNLRTVKCSNLSEQPLNDNWPIKIGENPLKSAALSIYQKMRIMFETNPIQNAITDVKERTSLLRGYL
jgi:hypothetical protein